MALASTIISAVGDLLVLIALIVAVKALYTANGARADALNAEQTASDARLQAADREVEAVRLAQEQLEQARTTAMEADQRARDAADRDRAAAERGVARDQEAFLERQYERVLAVGQIVEDMFWAIDAYRQRDVAAGEVPKEIWMPWRNGLRHRLVGLKAALPSCQQIIDAGTAYQAFAGCVQSRSEVEVELRRIDLALDQLRAAFRVRLGLDGGSAGH